MWHSKNIKEEMKRQSKREREKEKRERESDKKERERERVGKRVRDDMSYKR